MNEADIEPRVLACFLEVAPDINPATLDRDAPFRDQFDFDSMDTLNFAIGLHKAFGIEIPATDHRYLAGLGKAVAYVSQQIERTQPVR